VEQQDLQRQGSPYKKGGGAKSKVSLPQFGDHLRGSERYEDYDFATDSDSFSEFDDSTEDSASTSSEGLPPAVTRGLNQILGKHLDAYGSNRQQAGPPGSEGTGARGQQPSRRRRKSNSSSNSRRSTGDSSSAGSKGKRPLTDDDSVPATASKKRKAAHQRGKLLACPFWKKDPVTYSRCYRLGLKEVKHVKQHLRRNHRAAIRCPRCQQVFPDRESCDRHIRDEDCDRGARVLDEGISESQVNELGRKGPSSLNQEQRWYAVWRIVFPGIEPPASPYMDDDLNEELSAFREFFQRDGSKIILNELRMTPGWTASNEELLGDGALPGILNHALDQIYSRWLAGRHIGSGETTTVITAKSPGGEPTAAVPSELTWGVDAGPLPNDEGTGGFQFVDNVGMTGADPDAAEPNDANSLLFEEWWSDFDLFGQHKDEDPGQEE